MKTIDQLKVIDTLLESPDFNPEKVIISDISKQSFKVLHPCGCYFISHGYAGRTMTSLRFSKTEMNDEMIADRFFFVELCNKHK